MSDTVINRTDWIRLSSTMTEVKIVVMSVDRKPDIMAVTVGGSQFTFPKSEAEALCEIIMEVARK